MIACSGHVHAFAVARVSANSCGMRTAHGRVKLLKKLRLSGRSLPAVAALRRHERTQSEPQAERHSQARLIGNVLPAGLQGRGKTTLNFSSTAYKSLKAAGERESSMSVASLLVFVGLALPLPSPAGTAAAGA